MGKGTNDKDLVRVLVNNSNAAYEWFKAIGGKLELQSKMSDKAPLRAQFSRSSMFRSTLRCQ